MNDNNMAPALTHFFHQYLRLGDGMNLMTSGECRHAGDVQQATSTTYKSQLNQQSHCGDGYTKLYSSDHYSGYGWDEFFDSNVGVLSRLKQQLGNKTNAWNVLLDSGAQAFEACLDQHETSCHEIQSRFDQLRNTMVKDLRQHCASVTMTTRDKMERLQVTLKGDGTHVSLERRANAFQVHGAHGCLPDGWQVVDWKRAMDYTPPRNKKRVVQKRRVIVDSDEDGEEVILKKKKTKEKSVALEVPAVDGLRVQVKNKVVPKKEETVDVSLAKLKESLEVDAEALEASREVLEAEEVGGEKSRAVYDDDIDEIVELKQNVVDARTKVERLKRVVVRVTERQDEFDEEVSTLLIGGSIFCA